MSESAAEKLLAELNEVWLRGTTCHPRLRMAVTGAEYELIRARCLEHDGRFYARVRNIPLIVDENAAKPLFHLELAEKDLAQ